MTQTAPWNVRWISVAAVAIAIGVGVSLAWAAAMTCCATSKHPLTGVEVTACLVEPCPCGGGCSGKWVRNADGVLVLKAECVVPEQTAPL